MRMTLSLILIASMIIGAAAAGPAIEKMVVERAIVYHISGGNGTPEQGDTMIISRNGWNVTVASDRQGREANGLSGAYQLTATTEKAVFHSWATNLIAGTEKTANAYLKDTTTGDISLIQVHSRFPAISPDGRYIAYEYGGNYDTDLPILYLRDTITGKDTFVAYTSGGNAYGWSTQEFILTNKTLQYNTTYPYPGVNGMTTRVYTIGGPT